MNVDKIMRDPLLKIERAKHHIDSIVDYSSPLFRELYDIRLEHAVPIAKRPDLKGEVLVFIPQKPIPQFFAMLMGDAVHNLRSAFDCWAAALVSEVNGTTRDTRVYFPFWGKGQNIEGARGYGPIHKALPEAIPFIRDTIKPHPDGTRDLWSITELDNIDKHNFILPTVALANVADINMVDSTGSLWTNIQCGGNAADRIILISTAGIRTAYSKNFKASVDITFPKGGLFEDEPVIPTMLNLHEVAFKALQSLEGFLRTIA